LEVRFRAWAFRRLARPRNYWRVPLDGSERRNLDLNVTGMTPFSVPRTVDKSHTA
jgi:hypothetical protein